MNNLFEIYETFLNNDENINTENNYSCSNCKSLELINEHNMIVCNNCGIVNYTKFFDSKEKSNKTFYKRKNYIKNLINEVNRLPCDHNINHIYELIMKNLNNQQINYLNVRKILKKKTK